MKTFLDWLTSVAFHLAQQQQKCNKFGVFAKGKFQQVTRHFIFRLQKPLIRAQYVRKIKKKGYHFRNLLAMNEYLPLTMNTQCRMADLFTNLHSLCIRTARSHFVFFTHSVMNSTQLLTSWLFQPISALLCPFVLYTSYIYPENSSLKPEYIPPPCFHVFKSTSYQFY